MFWLKFRIFWSRKWQPTPVFLPGRFHGQNSPADYSPWDGKESDMTEHTHTNLWALVFTVVPQPSHIYFSVYSRRCSLCVFPIFFFFSLRNAQINVPIFRSLWLPLLKFLEVIFCVWTCWVKEYGHLKLFDACCQIALQKWCWMYLDCSMSFGGLLARFPWQQ